VRQIWRANVARERESDAVREGEAHRPKIAYVEGSPTIEERDAASRSDTADRSPARLIASQIGGDPQRDRTTPSGRVMTGGSGGVVVGGVVVVGGAVVGGVVAGRGDGGVTVGGPGGEAMKTGGVRRAAAARVVDVVGGSVRLCVVAERSGGVVERGSPVEPRGRGVVLGVGLEAEYVDCFDGAEAGPCSPGRSTRNPTPAETAVKTTTATAPASRRRL
jgi:hypothetical protein